MIEMYAPTVLRFDSYGIPFDDDVLPYAAAIRSHPHVDAWVTQAHAEPRRIDRYER